MKWNIKYEPAKGTRPWSIYAVYDTRAVYQTGFDDKEKAERWVDLHADDPPAPPAALQDEVAVGSDLSFPASDPPAWVNSTDH